ncbi:glycoside hydrolase family 2 TIM barrel-domain containing protein [Pseudarthrobacter sp. LMD1-1-1.1]|uniref:glycoside hydrolase family 2 TIM barrel-domain containing protein n=1 Tax=Pseudarthrobacter sp. LMD1-1-1.1 TaxID=3135242 RepID=UPI00342C6909
MTTTLFTSGWTFHRADDSNGIEVRLPHDAMISEERSESGGAGNHGGYFPGGIYTYRKRWTVPDDADICEYSLTFEGVYGSTRVSVDGAEVGRNESPYREFTVPLGCLLPQSEVLIEVNVDNSCTPNSRWYTGSGIYRPVWMTSSGTTRIAPDGVRVQTRSLTRSGQTVGEALVDITVAIEGDLPDAASVQVELLYDGSPVATGAAIVDKNPGENMDGGVAGLTLHVASPRLWSAEHPNLHDVRVRLETITGLLDERTLRTGLRTIDVDALSGLRINGEAVLLRGTAVHHDNGPLGAATFAPAERRRARLLKEAGFNAIRSAHNPLSRAFLDACDELGLYVMDELSDVWFQKKTPYDSSDRFLEAWPDDVAAMIAKDRNRPSVILYSIGNEIAESATGPGVKVAKQIQARFRELDPTRPTTIAVNPLLAMMAARAKPSSGTDGPPERKPATSTAANQLTAKMGRLMVLASTLPAASRATRDVFDVVDVAGYNYGYAGYRGARRRYPERVIVGSESMPGDLPAIWKRVTSIPGVIGDFSWTGWDYLGEVGLGYWSYENEPGGIAKPYPGVLAGCGIFDITGQPGAALHLTRAVWGLTSQPGIAVRPLDRAGQRPNKTPWLSTDALPTWSWSNLAGIADIEVYSTGDQVELQLNGRSIGRRRAGKSVNFLTTFRAPYERGELTAIAYLRGKEIGRSSLRSAGNLHLTLRPESDQLSDADDLCFVWIELADEDGIVDAVAEDHVRVSISGPGSLIGLASAAPFTRESYADDEHSTYRGRALAVIRGTGEPGTVTVRVSSDRHGSTTTTLEALGDLPHTPSRTTVPDTKEQS